MAHDDRWDYDDPYRPRRYGNDEEYERNFWQRRESRGRGHQAGRHDSDRHYPESPTRRYESAPVLGMDFGRSNRGYNRDTDWSTPRREPSSRGERGWWDRTKDEVRSWMGDVNAEHRREADYRGRGPRGYTRSDERIREEVSDALMEDRYVDASEIDVAVAGGEVTLAGTVDSRQMKRRAEDIAANVLGVQDVHNSLRARATSSYGASAVSGASPAEPESRGRTTGEPRH